MQLTLYTNFSKRKNSTKQPTGGTSYDVKLKDGCNTENPVFMIDGINLDVTYAQWNGAYYFVDSITLRNNNIYEIACSIDVLATFKTAIGNSTQFIERSASDYDEFVNDPIVSTSTEIADSQSASTSITSILNSDGCYLVRCFSKDGVNIYGFTDMTRLSGILNNNNFGISDNALSALVTTIGANIFDVTAYMSNVLWLPVALSRLGGDATHTQMALGFWAMSNASADKKITDTAINQNFVLNKPTNVYTDFRAYDPAFSKYFIRLPGVGVIQIPSFYFKDKIEGVLCIDVMTGQVTYKLFSETINNNRSIIGEYSGQLGVQIPYSTTHWDVLGLAQQILNPSGMISGMMNYGSGGGAGAIAGAVGGAVDFAFNTMRATFDTASSINNGAGNISNIKQNLSIVTTVTNSVSKEFPLAEGGRPLYEHRQISTLSGFVKCNGASLDCTAHGNEKNILNAYLNSGFYYE